MRKWLVLLSGILFFSCIGSVRACIGNDLTQLRKVYGSASQVLNSWLFCKDGFSIAVYLDSDKSAMEVFSRDPQAKDQRPLDSKDVDNILSMEGNSLVWSEAETRSGLPVWLRSDGKVLARVSYADGKRVIVVMANKQ